MKSRMIQHRGRPRRSYQPGPPTSLLPMTSLDCPRSPTPQRQFKLKRSSTPNQRSPPPLRRPRGRRRNHPLVRLCIIGTIIVGAFYVGVGLRTGLGSSQGLIDSQTEFLAQQRIGGNPNQLKYSHYKSLEYAFAHSDVVALYFAASWCPMSSRPTKQLEEFFGGVLLPPPSDSSPSSESLPTQKVPLSLVYVSSDDTENQFNNFLRRHPTWMSVPYQSQERNELKYEFSVCAKKELPILQMERKHEIPTLILLDGQTHEILTVDGLDDLNEHGRNALDHWMELHELVRALRDKYEQEQ